MMGFVWFCVAFAIGSAAGFMVAIFECRPGWEYAAYRRGKDAERTELERAAVNLGFAEWTMDPTDYGQKPDVYFCWKRCQPQGVNGGETGTAEKAGE